MHAESCTALDISCWEQQVCTGGESACLGKIQTPLSLQPPLVFNCHRARKRTSNLSVVTLPLQEECWALFQRGLPVYLLCYRFQIKFMCDTVETSDSSPGFIPPGNPALPLLLSLSAQFLNVQIWKNYQTFRLLIWLLPFAPLFLKHMRCVSECMRTCVCARVKFKRAPVLLGTFCGALG